MRRSAPPVLARAILARVVDAKDREFLLSDLDEEFAERCTRDGEGTARRWYRAQVATSVVPLALRRLRRAPVRPRAGAAGFADALLLDVRFGARTLLRRPGFTLAAVGTLAIAIGANTAVFSIANGLLLRGVPGLSDTGGLVELSRDSNGDFADLSYPVVDRLRQDRTVLESVSAFALSPISVSGEGEPVVRMGIAADADHFRVLRLTPSAGRFFLPGEATPPLSQPVAVVSHHLAEQRFGSARAALGSVLRANGVPLTIVGVGPERFRGHGPIPVDVYVPLGLEIPGLRSATELRMARSDVVEALARLNPGVRPDDAARTLSAGSNRFFEEIGDAGSGTYDVRVAEWAPIPAVGRTWVRLFIAALMVIVGLLLALACVNVTGMVLARSVERLREVSVRLALGAGRGRLARQLMTEALLLFALGGVGGVMLSLWLIRLLLAFEPPLPAGYDLELSFAPDWRVLAFSMAVTVLTALVFNLAPALRAARTDLMRGLGRSAGGDVPSVRLRALLVSGQMFGATILLVIAGLFIRSLSALERTDPGWTVDDVHAIALDLELTGTNAAAGEEFFRALRTRAAGLPGVVSVGLAAKLPLAGRSSFGLVQVPGAPLSPSDPDGHAAFVNRVSAGYFETLRIERLAGRDFNERDVGGSPRVAVINRAMADRLWPAGDALGGRFIVGGSVATELTVVGIVENAKYRRLVEPTPNFYYVPAAQWYNAQHWLFVRTAPGSGGAPLQPIADMVRELQPHLPLAPAVPLRDALEIAFLPQRIAAWVAGVVGVLGLLLGAVGAWGVAAFTTGLRTREIGVRLALGARQGEVLRLIVGQGMTAPLAGISLGIAGALVLGRALRVLIPGVSPVDPASFAFALAALLLVAALATFLPALRAIRSNPLDMLRGD